MIDERLIAASLPINAHYRRLGDRILVGNRWVDGADAATFAILDGKYAADRHHIYYADILCRVVNSPMHSSNDVPCVVDRASFRVIAEDFARDRGHVYWQNDVVCDVAPDAFSVLPRGPGGGAGWYARDHGRVLYFYAGIHRSRFDDATRTYLAALDHRAARCAAGDACAPARVLVRRGGHGCHERVAGDRAPAAASRSAGNRAGSARRWSGLVRRGGFGARAAARDPRRAAGEG